MATTVGRPGREHNLLRPDFVSGSCPMRHRVAPSDVLKDAELLAGGQTPQSKMEDCDAFDYYGDEDSVKSSLFSEPEEGSVWNDEEEEADVLLGSKKVQSDLDHLEAKFKRRDRILDRISQGKNTSFINMLRRHEQIVRVDERERLVLKLLYGKKVKHNDRFNHPTVQQWELKKSDEKGFASHCEDATEFASDDSRYVHLTVSREDLETLLESYETKSRRKISFFSTVQDVFTFELFCTIPAVFSLTLHTLLEYLFYEIACFVVSIVRNSLNLHEDTFIFLVLLTGLSLIRMSGYLYWWLSDSDYNCVKFEFHNRLRLGKWDARLFRWMQEHVYARCFIFVLGYYFCFIAVIHFYFRFANLWDESEKLMKDLPSSRSNLQVCVSDLPPWSCHLELDGMMDWKESQRIADVTYTYGAMSPRSFELFWIENGDLAAHGYPILSHLRETVLTISAALVSLAALSWYGFQYCYKY